MPVIIVTEELDAVHPPLAKERIGCRHDDACLVHDEGVVLLDLLGSTVMEPCSHDNKESRLPVQEIVDGDGAGYDTQRDRDGDRGVDD